MIAAATITVILEKWATFTGSEPVVLAKTALLTAGCTTLAWVVATFVTPAESEDKLVAFYRRVRPTVHGWKKIARLAPEVVEVRDLRSNALDWLMGCLLIYC